jgi:amidohydrolase
MTDDLPALVALRHALHRAPELSGAEAATAAKIAAALPAPDALVTGLGGHGVAAVYAGAAPGPTVMLRAELDALPIPELTGLPHASRVPGHGHLCGHDGHATILVGVARRLAARRPAQGRVVLMFQPAEETGAGAAAVLADPRFAPLRPDLAFAIHNWPGLPLGVAEVPEGPANCASCGLVVALTGRTAHAAEPERGLSPAPALARLVPALSGLGAGGALVPGFRLATVTHLRMGAPAFGVAPAEAEVWVTLRALDDAGLEEMLAAAERLARAEATAAGLTLRLARHDHFAACANAPEATWPLRRALVRAGFTVREGAPMRPSEDFGRFRAVAPTAMAFVGAGRDVAPLHAGGYDFPDALIGPAVGMWAALVEDLLG